MTMIVAVNMKKLKGASLMLALAMSICLMLTFGTEAQASEVDVSPSAMSQATAITAQSTPGCYRVKVTTDGNSDWQYVYPCNADGTIAGSEVKASDVGTQMTDLYLPENLYSASFSTANICKQSLKQIHIMGANPQLQTIGGLSYCSNLTTISGFENCSNLQKISDYAFENCTALISVRLPNTVSPLSLGWGAFSGDTALQTVVFSNSVASISHSVFYDCSALQSVPNFKNTGISTISEWAFIGCNSLTSIALPNSCKTIESSAFSGCSSLKSVSLPEGLTSVNSYAFNNCIKLSSITIPASVLEIEYGAFQYCTNLSKVVMLGNKPDTLWPNVFSDTRIAAGKGYIYVRNDSGHRYLSAYKKSSWSGYASRMVAWTPTVTSQPKSVTTKKGKTVKLTTKAVGLSEVSYQWQYKKPGGSWKNVSGSAGKASTLKVKAKTNGVKYRCKITNSYGKSYSTTVKVKIV